MIEELAGLDRSNLLEKLHTLGDEAATRFLTVLPDTLTRFKHIVVLTHVPPFPESCLWEGNVTSADWLPHVCCKAVGDVLREAMTFRPDRRMTVLCGYTHQAAEAHILPNLKVLTGGVEYYKPRLQGILEFS